MQLKIEIKGQEYNLGLSWGLGCFEIASKHLDVDNADQVYWAALKDKSTFSRLVYSALQNNLELEDETAMMPFSYRQFQSWLSPQPQSLIDDIKSDFESDVYNDKTMKSHYDELVAAIESIKNPSGEVEEVKPKAKKKIALVK